MNYVTLSGGVKMPQLGYGVYQVTKDECERCVLDAIKVGYLPSPTLTRTKSAMPLPNAAYRERKCSLPRKCGSSITATRKPELQFWSQ